MSVADLTMPDPIRLAREYLTETGEVTALVSTRVLSRTGDPLPTRPFVRLDLIGGRAPVPERLDQARIQVHVVGAPETEPATTVIAQTIRAAFVACRNFVGDTGVIAGVDIESGPMLVPDQTHTPPMVDVTFTVSLYTRPL